MDSNIQTALAPAPAPAVASKELLHSLKPSVFTQHPWESLLQKTEAEIVARNIMVIRKRLGDKWPLTWAEYELERSKDGGPDWAERGYFDEVMPLIQDAIGAISFSTTWAKAARRAV